MYIGIPLSLLPLSLCYLILTLIVLGAASMLQP